MRLIKGRAIQTITVPISHGVPSLCPSHLQTPADNVRRLLADAGPPCQGMPLAARLVQDGSAVLLSSFHSLCAGFDSFALGDHWKVVCCCCGYLSSTALPVLPGELVTGSLALVERRFPTSSSAMRSSAIIALSDSRVNEMVWYFV